MDARLSVVHHLSPDWWEWGGTTVFVWSSLTTWWDEHRSHPEPKGVYQAERVPVSSLPDTVQPDGGESPPEKLRLTPVIEGAKSAPDGEPFHPSALMDEYYLGLSVWESLEKLDLDMPADTQLVDLSYCKSALRVRRETRFYGKIFDIERPLKICAGLRKFGKYEKRRDDIDKVMSGGVRPFVCLSAAVILWLIAIGISFPGMYKVSGHGPAVLITLIVIPLVIFICSIGLRWRNIMTSLSVSRVTASVLVGLLIFPGTYIFISHRYAPAPKAGKAHHTIILMLHTWQAVLVVISFSVAIAILLGWIINVIQNSAELRWLPPYIDDNVTGVMSLKIADDLRKVKERQSELGPLYADSGLKRVEIQLIAQNIERLARVIEILFISASRRTLVSQSVALLNSWKRLITSSMRARASLILLPGVDYDAIIQEIVAESSLMLDGDWNALASRQAAMSIPTEPPTSRLMNRIVLASTILVGAFILLHLPTDLLSADQKADAQKTLVVSAFFALINAREQKQ